MYDNPLAAWTRTGMDAWSLGIDASTVVGLRMLKFAAGDQTAIAESRLMVAEKMMTAFELQLKLMRNPLSLAMLQRTQQTLQHYGVKVASNRRRLAR
jgi:hypothetical protein